MKPSIRKDPQQEWIDKFIAESNKTLDITAHLRGLWFRNPTNHKSLRLTHQGWHWIEKHTNIPTFRVRLSEELKSKHFIQLERVFTSPYFINANSITVLNETDYIMLQLHAGDLPTYLNNLQL